MLLSLVVATEKPAYVPQEPIAVRVSGLAPGETVEMQVLHTDATPNAGAGHEPWQITDGGQDDRDGIVNGQVLTVCSLAADDSANSAFQVTARELTSGEVASAAFQGIQDQPPTRPSTTVTTDKPDYSPGETATITASGFTPGETVKFLALHIDDTPNTGVGHQPWEVTDGGVDDLDGAADGSVLTTWHLAEDDSLHSVFQVTATGLTSGLAATAEFSDAQTLVFSDDFPHNAWDHTKWSTDTIWIFRDNGDSGPINPPSYPYAAGFSGDNRDRLQSVGIDLSNALDAKLYYSLQCSGHMDWPAGGNFSIEYRNGSGSWNSLWMWSAGMFQSNSQWTTQSISFGPSFVSSNFQIRFCLYDESAFDWWFLDNVQLYATMNSSPTLNVSGTFGTQSDKVLAPPGPSFNWTASDVDGNLSTVSAVVKYNGSVIASPSWQVR
jgi:hypothetical protein